jgi:succinate dehydrogenase/fumarate reductase cytochrome b subunit
LAPIRPVTATAPMNDSLKTLLIVAFLGVILWNLGAGLYYMLVDKGATKRTVNALTKRIALSVALILLVALSIYMGWITPHGVGR